MADKLTAYAWLDPAADPMTLFSSWFAAAEASEPNDPNAMALATIDADGTPSVRIVLLKAFDASGFTFFTNYESRKGDALAENQQAAFSLHWKSLQRQIRVEGTVSRVDAATSDAYFAQRPRQSQLGAWASLQSRPLPDRATFETRLADYEAKFLHHVPRPPHWGGYKLVPRSLEFWQQFDFRLHDRALFTRQSNQSWHGTRLYP